MAGLNQVQLIGRLGRDPEEKSTKSGDAVSRFSVAVDSGWGDNKRTEWFNVVSFKKTAEFVNQYLTKGSLVFVQGELRTEEYEKDGETRKTVKVYGNVVQSLSSGNGNGNGKKKDDDEDTDSLPW